MSPPTSPSAPPEHLRRLAYLLDSSIPLPFGVRIGWDAVLGLVPGLGDGAGALVSGYIVLKAARLGAPPAVLLRMVGNVGLEALVGAFPLVGDVFDAAWKANVRNVRLLEAHLATPLAARRSSRAWVLGMGVLLVLVLGGGVALAAVSLLVLTRWLSAQG